MRAPPSALRAPSRPMARRSGFTRHLVVTRKRTGLGSDLASVIGGLRFASRTDRDLLIDWRNSCYLPDRSENLFGRLFTVPKTIGRVRIHLAWGTLEDSALPAPVRYSGSRGFLDFHEELVAPPRPARSTFVVTRPIHHLPDDRRTRALFKSIRPLPHLLERIEGFRRAHFLRDRKVVGIHIRHGNGEKLGKRRQKLAAAPPESVVDRCRRVVDSLALADPVVFLCTDSPVIRNQFESAFPRLCHSGTQLGASGSGRLHRPSRGLPGAESAVIDMWLLSRCDIIVHNPSWFSHYARCTARLDRAPIRLDASSLYGTRDLHHVRASRLVERERIG